MTTYRYRALTKAGEIVSGELAAETYSAAITRLQELGYFPINAAPAGDIYRTPWREWFTRDKRFDQTDVELLTQQLSMLVTAGLTVERALMVMADSATEAAKTKVLQSLLEAVRAGLPLSQAIEKFGEAFPAFYRNTLRAAEEGGFLALGLQRLSEYLTNARSFRETIRSALIYPAILLTAASISALLVLTLVLPQFRPLFAEAKVELPFLAAAVMAISGGLVDHPLVALAGVVLFAAILLKAYSDIRAHRGSSWLDRWSLKIAAIRDIVVGFEVARFSYALGLLLENGAPLPTALSLSSGIVRNATIARITGEAASLVKEGKRLADAVAVEPFPKTAIELIRVGEETGQLSQTLTRIARLFDEEAQRSLKRAIAVSVPAITVVLGGFVALLVVSILSALININQAVI